MRVKIIINPAAGQAEPILSVLNDVFGPTGIEWGVAITHKRGDARYAELVPEVRQRPSHVLPTPPVIRCGLRPRATGMNTLTILRIERGT